MTWSTEIGSSELSAGPSTNICGVRAVGVERGEPAQRVDSWGSPEGSILEGFGCLVLEDSVEEGLSCGTFGGNSSAD